jgi:recombination protein RecT
MNNKQELMQKQIKLATPQVVRAAMTSNAMQKQMQSMINDPKKRDAMVSSMVAMVQQTPELQKCEVGSVFNAAIAGAALNLPYGFGYFYAVPRANNKKGKELGFKNGEYKEATWQMGYRGYIQLAMRSGEYKDIDVFSVKEGEILNPQKRNKMPEDFIYIEDREEIETIGYYAYFELLNGFKKGMYWTKKQMIKHASEYSFFKAHIHEKMMNNETVQDAWRYSSEWYNNFDMMAEKTVLKRLLSKWGILSTEMQSAIKQDQALIGENGVVLDYPDNPKNEQRIIDAEPADETPKEISMKDL